MSFYDSTAASLTAQAWERLTDEHLQALAREAGQAGDIEAVILCDDAVWGLDIEARQACCTMINDARAMDDETPFVLVVP